MKESEKIVRTMGLILLLFFSGSSVHALESEMRFDRVFDLGSPGGQTMLQDNDGFLWIGTEGGGMFRYDGYELKPYGAGPGMLSNGTIWKILEDADHPDIFWIGTSEGLNRFDKATETFTCYKHDPNDPHSPGHNSILDIVQDGNDSDILWLATYNGLNRFSKKTGQCVRYDPDPSDPDKLNFPEIWRMIEDRDDPRILWLGTFGGGLDRFDKRTETFTHFVHDPNNPESLGGKDNIIGFIAQDKDHPDMLWIGTNNGLDRFDKTLGTFTHFVHNPDDPDSIMKGVISLVHDDGDGRLWLGGYVENNGLTLFDKKTGTFTNYKNEPGNPNSLSNDLIVNVYEDQSGIFWITSYSGKVDKYDETNQNFRLYQQNPQDPNSLSDNVVTVMAEDREGTIWLGTQGGGLNAFDRKTGKFTHYRHHPDDPDSLDTDHVLGVFEDSSGNLWVSLYVGPLLLLDKETGRVTRRYKTRAESFTIISEDPDDPDILWLGVRGGLGFAKFDKRSETFRFYEPDPERPRKGPSHGYSQEVVQDICDPHLIWLGCWEGGSGLNKFDKRTELFVHYKHDPNDPNSLSGDAVADIYQDASGLLWIGILGGGLNKFDPATETFTHFAAAHGVPADVYGILEDDHGRLWLSTGQGIICFNPGTETVERHYTRQDGLQGNAFLFGSTLKTREGRMWFGGTNGVNSFFPDRLTVNPYIPPVVLTSLTQGGETANWDHHKVPARLEEITLDWQRNFFEFEYAALNYTIPEKNQYKYMLEGFDKDWYDAGTKRTGRYSGLPGGEYTLRIIGANNDGVWNTDGVSLRITVIPPFWKTVWFRAFLFLLMIGSIGGGVLLRVRTIRKQNRRLEIQVSARTRDLARSNEQLRAAKEKAEVADLAKSTFLANMSHELRTPLNAVLGFAQILRHSRNLDPDEREDLEIILRSGEHLLTLISQLLDLSKIEAGRMTLHETNFDLYVLLDDITDMFRLRAEEHHLQFLSERSPALPRYIRTDEVRLRQVLINLLSNAFKFTEEGGVAMRVGPGDSADLKPEARRLRFEIEDTGPGIPQEEWDTLFENFGQTRSGRELQEAGTGLGLPISRKFVQLMGGDLTFRSEVGQGTLFSFDICAEVVHAADIQERQATRRVMDLEPGQPRYRVLVVDDKWENRHLVMKLLSPLGFELQDAANGQEAIEKWERWNPHLIWMDMRMPVMDGYKAVEQIKATTKGQATAVIALTASAFDEEKAVVLSAGCDDFLRKPFKEGELFDLMHKHLGVRYVYEDIQKPESGGKKPKPADVLTPEALAKLPDDVLAEFRRAVKIADFEAALRLAERIRKDHPALGEAFSELVNNYQFGVLLSAFEKAEEAS